MNETQFRVEFCALDFWLYDWPAESEYAWISGRKDGAIPVMTTMEGIQIGFRETGGEDTTPAQRRDYILETMEYWNQSTFPTAIEDGHFVAHNARLLRNKALRGLLGIIQEWGMRGTAISPRMSAITRKVLCDEYSPEMWSVEEAVELEEQLMRHYMERYTFVFRRAPTLPRMLRTEDLD